MTPEEWRRVKTIAADALERPPEERPSFVAAACGADAALRDEVESLLASTEHAAHLYETPALDAASARAVLTGLDDARGSHVGRLVGAYRLLKEIGRGGMGAAYLAERADAAYERRVAIKLIKRGMDTDAIVRRFRHERQILANLNHPNIATLLDGGTTDDGLPYFVMEYVDGLPIDEYCSVKQLSIPERLTLFRGVCAAVHHAHERRVVHRDLKPANILVTADGVPKLLDFGIARLLDPGPSDHTADRTAFARAMTPQFASPEQIRGEPVTGASDVYSLGVLLYVLLTGTHPYRLAGRSPAEAERLVCEMAPPAPSVAIDRRARRRLAGDLDVIVLTAMSKDPARRYATVQALADDVARHLEGRPIEAHLPAGRRLRAIRERWRSSRRAVAAAAAALIAAVAAAGWLAMAGGGAGALDSVAVLPFSTSDDAPDLAYLSDGIAENVIGRLSRLPGVKVIARDSVQRYRGRPADVQQVARELGVRAVVTGAVRQSGDVLSVTAELVDASDGARLWGETYERASGDVQALQVELAQRVAKGLRVRLSGDEQARFTAQDRIDPLAYEAYLKGRYFWNRRTATDFEKSIGYFRQAVELEPEFAPAYAGLADSYALLTEYHARPAAETYSKAKAAVERALALDANLAEARTSLGYVKQFYEADLKGAEQEYKRAIELNPRYGTAHQWYAELLSAMGRHDEALAEIRIARSIDPLSLIINSVEAFILYMARRYDQAIDQALVAIDLDPNFPEVYEYLKRAYDQTGMYRQAIAARQTRRRLLGLDPRETPALRAAAAAASPEVYWRQRLAQELAEGKTEGRGPWEMVELLAQTGDIPGALDWLEKACADVDFMTLYVRVAPNLDPLRTDSRFRAVVERGCRV